MAISPALASQETGRVINEHYSYEEYVRRRVGYLSKRPDYAHINNLFTMVRGHADLIFASEQEKLSVQEVRRREQAEEIEDMLPLPTTNNTQTIDNFASYGGLRSMEWSPEVGWPVVRSRKTPLAMTQSTANTRSNVTSHQQTGTTVASATPHTPNSNQPTTNTLAMTSSSTVDAMAHNKLARLIEQTSPASSVALVHSNVAALSGRGMSVPVKVKPNKNKPTAASPPSEANDSVLGDEAMMKHTLKPVPEVAAKQTRGKKRAAPPSSSPENDTSPTNNGDQNTAQRSDSTPSPAKKLKTLNGPHKPSPPAKKPKAKPQKGNQVQAPRSIEAVIAGIASPQNALEASSASTTRRERLLARHLATHPEAQQDADLLPEFFNAAALEDDQQVRCICKLVEDDGTAMLKCEKCTVWQHAECMQASFEAYEADESKKYTCHVCDPWKHRKLIGGLRRNNPL